MATTRIINAQIIDGTGKKPFQGEVTLHGGVILSVGEAKSGPAGPQADQVIDAGGMVVCPAFVDIHRHPDIRPFDPAWRGEVELRQGIGTTVCGNCGMSMAPADPAHAREQYAFNEPVLGPVCPDPPADYPAYARALSEKRLPLNMAAMIGTGSVRTSIKGFSAAPYTPAELDRAAAMIDEALQCGAPGVSLGIMYLPECYTTADEYARLLAPVGRRGSVICTHMRGEGDTLEKSVAEVIDIAARAGCALEISHFKCCSKRLWRDGVFRAIERIEAARAHGQDVTCDFYPYTGGSTALTTMLPPAYVSGDLDGALRRLGTRAGAEAFVRASKVDYPDWDNSVVQLGWDRIVISGVAHPENRRFIGLSVAEAAERYGFDEPGLLAAHLMHTDGGKTAIITMSMHPDDVDDIAWLPYSFVISDAIYADTDTPHPRMYGAMPRMISDFVMKRHVLPLETAIHKMTGGPARRMGLQKGVIKPGTDGDILIFDPRSLGDNATYLEPTRMATGLRLMLLGGAPVIENDAAVRADAGRFVTRRYDTKG